MSEYWSQFLEEVPWCPVAANVRAVHVEPPNSWSPRSQEFRRLFPQLTRLLASSTVTRIDAAGGQYVLHSWIVADGEVTSWLSPAPPEQVPAHVCAPHRVLLHSFGGIVERSNEREDTWLLNQNEVLTTGEAEHDGRFIEAYGWAFADVPGGIPIALDAYYSIAREANGNTTLCHRSSGEVLLFAPDHSFEHVVPLEGCPPYTLYRILGGATFTEWVEAIARQWL